MANQSPTQVEERRSICNVEIVSEVQESSGQRRLRYDYPACSALQTQDVKLLTRAATATLQLELEGICRTVSVDETDDGLVVLAEAPEGNSLDRFIDEHYGEDGDTDVHKARSLGLGTVIQITRSLLETLAYAHKKEIIHGDIKPSNIYISSENEVTLAGFQFRAVARDLELLRGRIRYELMLYMAPEQFLGETPNEMTDIYSLGVVLYELLTGRTPFLVGDMVQQHLTVDPKPPSKFKPQLPEEMNRIVLKCLAKQANMRYQTAEDLLDELSSLEESLSETEKAAPEPEAEEESLAREPEEEEDELAEAFARQFDRPDEPGTILTEEDEDFDSEPGYAEQETAVIQKTAELPAAQAQSPADVLSEDESIEDSQTSTALVEMEDDVREAFEKGLRAHNEGNYTEAIESYTEAIGINPNFAPAYNNRALGYYDMGEYDLAIQDYTRAIELNQNYGEAYLGRGLAYYKKGQLEFAVHDYQQAIKCDEDNAVAYYNCGIAQYDLGEFDKAVANYAEVLKLEPEHATAYYNRGIAHYKTGNWEAAIDDFDRAIELNDRHHTAYYNRGSIYHKMKDYEKALADLTRAVELRPDYVMAYYSRGNVFTRLSRLDEAISDYTQVIKLAPNFVQAYFSRGCLYGNVGEYLKAVRDFDQAINLNPNYGAAFWNRAIAYEMLGYKKKSMADFGRADELGYEPK